MTCDLQLSDAAIEDLADHLFALAGHSCLSACHGVWRRGRGAGFTNAHCILKSSLVAFIPLALLRHLSSQTLYLASAAEVSSRATSTFSWSLCCASGIAAPLLSLPHPLPLALSLLRHISPSHPPLPHQRWGHYQPSSSSRHALVVFRTIHSTVAPPCCALLLLHCIAPSPMASFNSVTRHRARQVTRPSYTPADASSCSCPACGAHLLPYYLTTPTVFRYVLNGANRDDLGGRVPSAAPLTPEQIARDEVEALALMQQLCNRHLHSFIPKKASALFFAR